MKKLPKGKANDWKVKRKGPAHRKHDKASVDEGIKKVIESTEDIRQSWCDGHDEEPGCEGGIDLIDDVLTLAKYDVLKESQVSREQIAEAQETFKQIKQGMSQTNEAKFMLEMAEQAQKEEFVADFLHGAKGEVPTGTRNTTNRAKYRDI
jgi:hypothetical protein